MRIESDPEYHMVISENYHGVMMNAEAQSIMVCERSGGFEVAVYAPDGDIAWYSIHDGKVIRREEWRKEYDSYREKTEPSDPEHKFDHGERLFDGIPCDKQGPSNHDTGNLRIEALRAATAIKAAIISNPSVRLTDKSLLMTSTAELADEFLKWLEGK